MPTFIKIRSDTAANWTLENPILLKGEFGIQMTVGNPARKVKIGDGVTAWNDLTYAFDEASGGSGTEITVSAGYARFTIGDINYKFPVYLDE